jgi:predicted acetyltransferase
VALLLRPYRLSDEAAVALNEVMLDSHFRFLLWWDEAMSWPEYLVMLDHHRRGLDLKENQVRNAQLAAVVDGELVGRVAIRFEPNEFLSRVGGHVRYGVAPRTVERATPQRSWRKRSLFCVPKAAIVFS